MKRVPEPELMDEYEQAKAYADADFNASDDEFVDRFAQLFPEGPGDRIVDLGCGPGNISLRLAKRYVTSRVTGVDGAKLMLEIAEARKHEAQLSDDQLEFIYAVLPSTQLHKEAYSAVVSNSLLHHLHDPGILWQTIVDIASPGALVFVKDLRRPQSTHAASLIVDTYASDAPDILKTDFYNSLLAAFTKEEVENQLYESGLHGLQVESKGDRHIEIWGSID